MTSAVDCGRFDSALEGYLAETLAGEELRSFREHLHGCAPCRARGERRDPSLVFARLGGAEELPSRGRAAVAPADFLAGVRRGIAVREAEKKTLSTRHRHVLLRLAAAFAVVAIGGSVAWRLSRPPADVAPRPQVVASSSLAPQRAAAAPVSVARAGSGAAIEDLDRRNARVYDLNPEGGDDEPRVVLIVDSEMDI